MIPSRLLLCAISIALFGCLHFVHAQTLVVTNGTATSQKANATFPTRQKKTGRPTVTSDHQGTTYTLVSSDNYMCMVQTKNVYPKIVSYNSEDPLRRQYSIQYTRLFQTNRTAPPFTDAIQSVDGKEYTWGVTSVSKQVRDDKSVLSPFSAIGLANAGGSNLVRPTMLLGIDFLSNQDITESRMKIQVDQFQPIWWKANYMVLEFLVTTIAKDGSSSPPSLIVRNETAVNGTHVREPLEGMTFSGGNDVLLMPKVAVDGLDIHSGSAFSTSGNAKKVRQIVVTSDDKVNTTMYLVYDAFDTSLTHRMFLSLNAKSLSPAASLTPSAAFASIALMCIYALML